MMFSSRNYWGLQSFRVQYLCVAIVAYFLGSFGISCCMGPSC